VLFLRRLKPAEIELDRDISKAVGFSLEGTPNANLLRRTQIAIAYFEQTNPKPANARESGQSDLGNPESLSMGTQPVQLQLLLRVALRKRRSD
jgi:hypothetical protein